MRFEVISAAVLALGIACSARAESGAEAAAKYKWPVAKNLGGHENTEWSMGYAYHVTDGHCLKPRVLLIGDSICAGYQGAVVQRLEGKVNVSYWASSYGVNSEMYWKLLAAYLEELPCAVVHYCGGTHSYDAKDEEIESGVRRLVRTIKEKQPQAKLIWCTKTPVDSPKINPKTQSINVISARIATEEGVILCDDLYKLMDPLDRKQYWRDPFHFKPAGIELQADQIAKCVLSALSL